MRAWFSAATPERRPAIAPHASPPRAFPDQDQVAAASTGYRGSQSRRIAAEEVKAMWYFAWLLGAGLIGCFGILNAMWFELHADDERDWAAVEHDH
jgi:cyd operon protein YbgT